MNEVYENPIKVILTCTGEYIPEEEVEFVNIKEDIMGFDVLVFICPKCEKQHESPRLG